MQECLRPILLRRMKEDVETLPEKEEVIIWVELTTLQREYYKALYEKDIATLLTGVKSSALPGMRNLAMELRKLCCHPVRACVLPACRSRIDANPGICSIWDFLACGVSSASGCCNRSHTFLLLLCLLQTVMQYALLLLLFWRLYTATAQLLRGTMALPCISVHKCVCMILLLR